MDSKSLIALDLDNKKDLVESMLRQYSFTRNDDLLMYKMFIMRVLSSHGKFISMKDLEGLPTPESLTRVRRKIQNEEYRYLPTDPEVMRKRAIKCEAVSEWAVMR